MELLHKLIVVQVETQFNGLIGGTRFMYALHYLDVYRSCAETQFFKNEMRRNARHLGSGVEEYSADDRL